MGHGPRWQVGWCRAGLGVRHPCAHRGQVLTAPWTLPLRPGSGSWGRFTCWPTLPSPGAPVRPWPFKGAFLLPARDLLPPKFSFTVILVEFGEQAKQMPCHTLSSEAKTRLRGSRAPPTPPRHGACPHGACQVLALPRLVQGSSPHIHTGPPEPSLRQSLSDWGQPLLTAEDMWPRRLHQLPGHTTLPSSVAAVLPSPRNPGQPGSGHPPRALGDSWGGAGRPCPRGALWRATICGAADEMALSSSPDGRGHPGPLRGHRQSVQEVLQGDLPGECDVGAAAWWQVPPAPAPSALR